MGAKKRLFSTPIRMPPKEEAELIDRLTRIENQRGDDADVAFLLDLVDEYMERAYSACDSYKGEEL